MFTTYALECPVHFLGEKRTDRPESKTWQSQVIAFPFTAQPYLKYGEGVSQERGPQAERIRLGIEPKNVLGRQELPQAASSAGSLRGEVRKS
jgi:hypothetical protein